MHNNKSIMVNLEVGFEASMLDTLLVDLHEAQKAIVQKDSFDREDRQRVIQVISAILGTDLSQHDREMASDVVLSLIRQAETDLRESLAERLCAMENVPEQLILFLAHDNISVAKPVLQYSPCLSDTDLLYIIQAKGTEYWQAIARRRLLEAGVINALAAKRDEPTAMELLLNRAVTLPLSAVEIFADLSKYSVNMAEPLLRRPEIPRDTVMDIYWYVSQDLRDQIVSKFNITRDKVDEALQDALQDFADTAGGVKDPKPSNLMTDLARQYRRTNRINDLMLIKTLRRGQVRFFIALFAERMGLDHLTVFSLMRQVGGQGMAVACRAKDVTKENFISIFLLSRSLTRGDRAVDASELRRAIRYYDAMTPVMAARILMNTVNEVMA